MSVEYTPGPPTEPGDYVVMVEGHKNFHRVKVTKLNNRVFLFDDHEFEIDLDGSEITHHAGPFVMPKKENEK